MTLSITHARPGLEDVLELDRICLREADGEPLDTKAHRGKLERAIPRSEWATVDRDGQLVAYAYLWPLENADWFVGGLLIHPGHRTAPTVTALSRSFADLLRRIDAGRLKSHVLRSNTASLQLHKRLGFEIEQESEIAFAFSADCACLLRDIKNPRRLAATMRLAVPTDGRGSV